MKFRNLLMCLLFVGGLSASCIKEDNSDCFNIYRLALSYLGDENSEIFSEKIDRVDMYVFDGNGTCITSTRLSDAEVAAQLTTLPPLESGTYRIVCVGNAYDTKVENLDAKDHSKTSFAANSYINGETVSGNDPLYWSAINYTIEPYNEHKQIETKTTYFESSHYDILVEVVGVPALKSERDVQILLRAVSPYTDFNNNVFGDATTYVMETVHDGNITLSSTNNIMRHKNHEDVYVDVVVGGDVIASVNFADHIANHKIDTGLNECIIPFKIIMEATHVKVTVPDWFINNVTPDFGNPNE